MPFAAPAIPMPPAPPPLPGAAVGGKRESEIVVIPEKFYGVALKMKPPFNIEEPLPPPKPTPPPPIPVKPVVPTVASQPSPSRLPIILISVVVVLAVAGGFAYFNRDLLFKPTVPTPTPVVTAPEAPPMPAGLTVTAPNPNSASLTWRDVSDLETGYRLERREEGGTYLPVTNLPANSTSFQDNSVVAGKSYQYRLIALNQTGESPPSNEAGITVPATVAIPPASTVPALPPGGLDSDSDGLSDTEELLFGTDKNSPDTDGDGFNDGNEVFHLYDPTKKAPAQMVDSDLVKTFKATAGWQLWVPSAWNTKLNSADGSIAVVDSLHGETFTLAVLDNGDHLDLKEWYLAKHPEADPLTVTAFKTKKGMDGVMGAGRLDAYFAWDGKVLSLTYDLDGQTYVNFRTTFEMMLNSLTLSGVPQITNTAEMLLGPGGYVGPLGTPTSTATSTTLNVATSTAATSTVPSVSSTSTASTSTAP